MKVHFYLLEVSVIDTSVPTTHMVQIKMDFHCFDSSTEICHILSESLAFYLVACKFNLHTSAGDVYISGAIESMLECDSRAALQLIFVVEGIFDMFVTILTRITVSEISVICL